MKEYDLCGFVCPLSKMKATELMDDLGEGETVKIILGDSDSLKECRPGAKSARHQANF